MSASQSIETELRHAVIDRLIAASLRDGTPAREANLRRWREQSSVVSHQLSVVSHQSSVVSQQSSVVSEKSDN